VEWFGGGPGEAYPDSRRAARIGRYRLSIDEMQTPYVKPQENGNRTGVRWAGISGPGGLLRLAGHPEFELTVRRWTSEHLFLRPGRAPAVPAVGDPSHVRGDPHGTVSGSAAGQVWLFAAVRGTMDQP
jgi:beta-galactosidase